MIVQFAKNIKNVILNKVIIYLISRYFTYLIQFITSILIAIKLGPYFFGVYGFVLLLITYFNQINFGISYSNNILLIQNRNNLKIVSDYIVTSLFLIGIYFLLIFLFAILIYNFNFPLIEKYKLGNSIYLVLIVGGLLQLNNLFMMVYRVNNKFLHIAFYQSIVPILVFLSLFYFEEKNLINVIIVAYIIGHFLSLGLFIIGKQIPFFGKPTLTNAKIILRKGIFLFVYNASFYFIIISVKTIISSYYTVEQFGMFTFSFTIANSAVLFIDAIAFLIFSKIIGSYIVNDYDKVKMTMINIRRTYVPISHLLIYTLLAAYPFGITFISKYTDTIMTFSLIAITILLQSNFYAQTTYLMAINKEKLLAIISVFILGMNICIALFIIYVFNAGFQYIILSTQISYLIMSFLCFLYTRKFLNEQISFFKIINEWMPVNIFVPYFLSIIIVLNGYFNLLWIPLFVFIGLNIKSLVFIKTISLRMFHNSRLIDLT
jgi:O-antigen/teichoic acid export membrane protein